MNKLEAPEIDTYDKDELLLDLALTATTST